MRIPGNKSRWVREAVCGALLIAAACLPRNAAAAELQVSNATDIATASALAQPGDTLVMRDGVWTDADIVFSANGTAANPITLRAQTLGRVYLSGLSRLRLSGNFLVVDGLVFTNGYRTSGEVISFLANSVPANNSRLINCAVVDYSPPNNALDTKWVRLYGISNRVEYCYFRGKTNAGGTLIVEVGNAPNYHVIARNYFGFRPALGVNGGETMRIGDSTVSLNQSRTTVEENLFEQCNGDAEIVSSKSLENIFRHNTFVECEGTLCLRHGNGSTVEGNYFFGNHKPLTGGVRVVGENHRIFNNYFANLAGTASRAPLSIMQGLTNSPLNGYYQVKNATVAFNTFVNCTNSLVIGLVGTLSGTPYVTTLPPTNCTIANNIMLQPAGKIVDQRTNGLNFTWEGNLLFGTTLGVTNPGALKIDPLLTFTGGLWRPDTNSPALGAAQGTYDFVANDFEGDVRTGFKDVGCDQASASPSLYPPLDSTSVGPLWMRTRGTFLAWSHPGNIVYGTPLGASQLNASANAAGTFVYSPPAGTILDAGSQVLTVVFTPTDLANFDVATQSVTINISKAVPTITWSNPATISYGTALGPDQLNAICLVAGALMYAPPEGAVLNAGNGQTLSVTFLPNNPNNYESVSRSVLIDVTKAQAQIAWPNPAAIEQGVALGAAQLNATANTSGTFTYSPPAGTILPAGIGHTLAVTFVPNNLANYITATRSVTIDVTIGGKLLPTLTWPTPGPILLGAALSGLQLNATANVPGTFAYTPPIGAVLPAGAGKPLTVTFTPTDLITYTTAVKTVAIDVALLTSNAILRVAYIVPANRFAQTHAVGTLRNLVPMYQEFFAEQMQRNGFGRKTFTFETEPDGVTPLINVVQVAQTDAFLRGDLNGNRIREAASAAGLPLGAPGQIWWLIAETHTEQPDGSIGGRFDLGHYSPTAPIDSGWAISASDKLALYQTLYQTNAALYDGYILPELGLHPLVQDLSFVWFEGITLSGVSSSAVGAGLRSIGEALGLDHDFRNDENFNGNMMGFGFRGIRGVFHPQLYPYNYCGLSYASALMLDVNQFFNRGRLVTDLVAPSASFTSTAARAPMDGLLEIPFHATDEHRLHAAILTWQTESDTFVAAEMALSGTNFTGAFAIPYYNSAQTNNYVLTVFDKQGNRYSTQAGIYALPSINHSPEPFIRVTPTIVGLGEDVVLDASDTFDPLHSAALLEVEWDFDGDGIFDTEPSTDLIYTVNYSTLGSRLIRARITDPAGDIVISAPVAVSVMVCTTSLSPTNRNHGYSFSTNTVTVNSGPKCAWTVENTNDWIHIFPDPEVILSGRWKLKYYTDPNPNFSVRTATMMIGDQVFYVSQDPAQCTFSVSPTNRFHGYSSSTSGTFKVSTKTNCVWNATSLAPWITITSGLSGTNNGNVTYSLTENRVTGRRSGNILVNETLFTVTQWGTNCEMVLSPYIRTHSENSETGMVTVSTATALGSVNCGWSVFNTNSWVRLTTPDYDTNSGSFGYVIDPNYAAVSRTAVLMVNEQSITITQQFCSYGITPSATNHGFISSTGSVKITAGAVCGWSIDNPNDWITITSELSGAGAGTVGYVVSPNPRGEQRVGRITIAGFEFTVTQSPAPCNYALDPTEYTHSEASEFLEIFVDADPGCQWEVVNTLPWVTILDGAAGEGPGYVIYAVEANTGPGRSGTFTIGPRDYSVSQDSGIRVITIGDTTIGSGGTNSLTVMLEAHGGENSLGFSLCFDTNLIKFVSAQPRPGGPVGLSVVVDTNQAPQGHVGFTMSLLGGHSMPPGTGVAVQVYFAAEAVEGRQFATVSSCDSPVPRYLSSAIGQALSANFLEGTAHLIGPCSLRVSLDSPELVWTNSAIPWICQAEITHDGDAAAMSGPTPDSGESYMQTTVFGPGTLSFWWKVSCETNNSDRLRFYLDGTQQFQISGETEWEWRTVSVPSGSHVLRWRYTKNSSVAVGRDAGFVDQVVYELSPPSITSQPISRSVDAGATATFSVTASGQPPLTYQWLFNNIALSDGANIRGTHTNTLTLSNAQPSQAGLYSVVIGNAQGNVMSTPASLSVVSLLPLPEALDPLNFVWTTNGNAGWVGQGAVTHDGVDAGRSGSITHSQSSSVQTIINGPGTLTFWWKVSCETNNDRVVFLVNGTERARISGEVDWQPKSFTIGAGPQTLLWTYSKSSSTSSGQDRAWVDEVQFSPAPVSITAQPVGVIVDQGSTATFSVTALGTPPVSYQWMLEGVDIPGATSATLTIPNVQPSQAGYYSVLVSNITGSVISSNALLQVNRLVPLAEAIDATNLVWTTNGTPPWIGQTIVAQDGVDAARGGRIADDGITSFRTTVTGPGTVSFWWKVSSQTNSDRLRFYIGSTEQQNISGEVDWTWRSLPVSSSGSQVLEWRYTKNASGVAGQDLGWVDQIYYIPTSTPAAPVMGIQPVSRTVVAPATVSLSAIAIGSTPLAYQWYFRGNLLTNGNGISGATTTNLTITSASAAQAGDYYVVVTNALGSVTSASATLTVVTAPVITIPPPSQNVLAGSTVIFNVGALGMAPLSYQWMCNGTNLVNLSGKVSGATNATLTLTGVQLAQEGIYSVLVSNAAGVAISSQMGGALTTFQAARSSAITDGEETTLQAFVMGPGTIRFSWKVSSETNSDSFRFLVSDIEQARISGEIDWRAETFEVPAGAQVLQWRYSKDASGSVGQDAGWVDGVDFIATNGLTAPLITTQPASHTVPTGATITFNGGADGSVPLIYQWRFNGAPLQNSGGISGAKTPRLTLANVQSAHAGNYSLLVSNVAGTATSSDAALTIVPPPAITVPAITSPLANQSVSENARVIFNVVAAGTPPLTYQWQFNGADLADGPNVAGVHTSSLILSNALLTQAGNYSVIVSNTLGVASANAALTVLSLGDAAGAPYLDMRMAGYTSWVAQTSATNDFVRSGVIPDNQNTRLETWVDGPGTITFRWKVSSEDVNDQLRFYIGATEMARISGEMPWQQQSFPVPAGTQQLLKWRYSKDIGNASGEDAGWVDDVQYVFTGVAIAPAVTNHPVSQSVLAGSTVFLTANVGGSFPLAYQWRLNGTNLPNGGGVSGVKTPRLTLTGVQPSQAGDYSLFVSNAAGTVTTLTASLSVIPVVSAPIVASQPLSQTTNEGASISFSVLANGAAPLTYQWQFNGIDLADDSDVSGATTPTLNLLNVGAAQIGSYSVIVSNAAGVVASVPASLTVLSFADVVGAPYLDFAVNGSLPWIAQTGQSAGPQSTNGGARLTISAPPTISSQPANRTIVAGNSTSFTVSMGGSAPFSIQWRFNGTPLVDDDNINGANTTTLTLAGVEPTNAGSYSVVISNAVGNITSSNATLIVLIPPSIVSQPPDRSANEGTPVSFTVSATGTGPLTYRWRRNGTNLVNSGSISGVTNATLTLSSAHPSQAGSYSVEVSNSVGTVVSDSAQLTVIAAMTVGEAMNAPYLSWDTFLDTPWIVQTSVTHDGEAAAQSGNITNGNSTWLETTVTGPGTIRFWWKVSSQTNADWLTFSVGGASWAQISGVVDWQKMSFDLPAGTVALRWTYSKDGAGISGLDRGWLDEVDFVPTTGPSVPVIVTQPAPQAVNPATTVTLAVGALGTAPLSYQWRFNGQNLGDNENTLGSKSPTLTLFNVQDAQAGLYDVVVRNPYSLALSEQVLIDVIPVIPLGTALDTTNTIFWTTGGFSPWRGQTDYNVDRIDAAQSGPVPNSQSNYIQTILSGPGAISFWWKVSSETNRDRLRFLINGVEQANISGEVDWRKRTFPVLLPATELRWVYTKDASGSTNLDRGWVDFVEYGPSAPIITNASSSDYYLDQGSSVRLSVDATGTTPFSYQWQLNGTNLVNSPTNFPGPGPGGIYGAVGNHRLTISNAQPHQSGTYSAIVMNQAGTALGPPMNVTVVPALPIGPALNPNLVWENGGYSFWVGTTNISRDGMAARNGSLENGRSALMSTTIQGAGQLKFWWRASTETNLDYVIFSINSNEMARISGAQNWQQKTFDLNEVGETYVLSWEYIKNGTLTNGLDQVFVDQVTYAPVAPTITTQPISQTVDQGSTVTFTAAAQGTPPFAYRWMRGGAILTDGGNVSGSDTATLRITGVQLNQAGAYSLAVSNGGGTAFTANAQLTVNPTFSLEDALDAALSWSPGSPAWVGQSLVTHDGADAARSPVIGSSQTATMQTTLSGPGTISFWWRTSSETNRDYLIFYGGSGSTELARISGERAWQQTNFTLPAGNQTLRWTYSKNGSTNFGQDRGWVDQFVFTPVPPTITSQPVSQTVDQGGSVSFRVAATGTPPLTYQWRQNGVNLDGFTSATLAWDFVQPWEAGNFSVVVANGGGSVTSVDAVLTVAPTMSLEEALDGTDLTWTTSGSGTAAWIGQSLVSHDGVDGGRIAGVPGSGNASMETSVTGPGSVTFWWKVSSETNNDRVIFYTNNTEAARISGEVNWQFKTFNLGTGTHAFRWTYSKNSGSTTGGQDRAWVDQVSFGPVAPTVTGQPTNLNVDVGATASFRATVSGTPPFTYQWQFEGSDLANGAGVSGATSSNLVLSAVQLERAGTYRVVVTGLGGTTTSADATLGVFPILTLAEALDAPGITWTTNGSNPPWIGSGSVSHDGEDAARSGAIGNSASNSMTAVVNGPITLSFWWKISSETNNDRLFFYVNNVEQGRISGEVDWQFKTVNLNSGSQTLKWTYFKNSGTTAGQDRAWVDQVSFGVIAPIITAQPANVIVDSGTTATFTVGAAATPPVSYTWLFNGAPLVNGSGISGANTATLTVSNAQIGRVGSYSVIVSNGVGTITSSEATLSLSSNVSIDQALDGGLIFTTGGTAQPWRGQQITTYDGIDAAQSGSVSNSTYSWIKTTVTGPGPLRFWWRVSSELDHDYLKFMLDGVEVPSLKISGEVPWHEATYNVPSGSHELQWRYSKNSSVADGQDRGWVDQVYFGTNPPVNLDPPVIQFQPVSQTTDAGEDINLSVTAASASPLTYRWLFNGTNVVQNGSDAVGATTSQLTLLNVASSQAGDYSVIVSNAGGAVMSTSARLTVNSSVDLADAVDTLELFVLTEGDAPWAGHTVVSHDGVDAARTGRILDGQRSTLETMVSGPGVMTFWWKVSSETNADFLTFSINGVSQASISGEVGWQQGVFNLPSGPQILEWTYLKNDSLSAGADRGWLDQLVFGPGGGTNQPSTGVGIGISVTTNKVVLNWIGNADKTYKVYYKNSLSDTDWTLLDGEISVTWQTVNGAIVPDVVVARCEDVLAGPKRFYRVLEF